VPSRVTVRDLRRDEYELWRRLRIAALAESPDAFGQTLADIQDRTEVDWRREVDPVDPSGSGSLLIGELDGTPVATAYVSRRSSEPDLAGLGAMWVMPEARGRGVGAALIDAALSWAAGDGCVSIELSVTVGNERARRVYQRAGFQVTGERRALRESSNIEIELMRRLVNADSDRR
jgi:ribosomal protein S18 acetylase RimI-like enzyme